MSSSNLLRRLASVRLAILLFVLIAFVSILGTFIPQGEKLEDYTLRYGDRIASLVVKSGLSGLYRSPGFIFLLFLLFLNLSACLITRAPQILSKWERGQWVKYIIRTGPLLAHASMILVLVGALTGGIWGESNYIALAEGEVKVVSDPSWKLQLNRFGVDYYDPERTKVSAYRSEVVILDDGSLPVQASVIEVNSPLHYRGWSIYLLSYGELPDRIRSARLRVSPPGSKPLVLDLEFGRMQLVPELNLHLEIRRFLADFRVNLQTGEYFSASTKPNNPALHLVAYRDQEPIGSGWVFLRHPGLSPGSTLPFPVEFLDYRPVLFVNFFAKRDPGLSLIWAGFILGSIGVCLGLFRRRG